MAFKDNIRGYRNGALAVLAAGAIIYGIEATGITPVQREYIRAKAETTRQFYNNGYGNAMAWFGRNRGVY